MAAQLAAGGAGAWGKGGGKGRGGGSGGSGSAGSGGTPSGMGGVAVAAFCEANEVLAVHEHMLTAAGSPTWALLLTFRERKTRGVPRAPKPEKQAALEVPEADRVLFEVLRKWRNERAKRDGKPHYIIFRNRQLADIARLRPSTLQGLQSVNGVGEGKCRDYGTELLALVEEAAKDG